MTPVNQWFGRKRIGLGWGPRSIEGWATLGLGIAIVALLTR